MPQEAPPAFEAYPIPFTNSLFLKWAQPLEIAAWELLDVTGRQVGLFEATQQAPQEIQGLENLKSGIYFIRAIGSHGNTLAQQRLIKW